jgi:uncharacterized repeat protein (TIGR03803 family)
MNIRIARLCTFTLISLFSLFGFAAQSGAQGYTFDRLSGPPKLREKTGKTDKTMIPEGSGYSVLYSFCFAANCTDGANPFAGLIQDAAGNLYGTTYSGGNGSQLCSGGGFGGNCGTVFMVDTAGQETVLYSFCSAANCTDGANPYHVGVATPSR